MRDASGRRSARVLAVQSLYRYDLCGGSVADLVDLSWDARTGLRWAEVLADVRRLGKTMSVKDSLIAATALTHALTVATRNERDFVASGVSTVNPFAPRSPPVPQGVAE